MNLVLSYTWINKPILISLTHSNKLQLFDNDCNLLLLIFIFKYALLQIFNDILRILFSYLLKFFAFIHI